MRRGPTLTPTTQVHAPIDSVEQHSAQLIASDACSRNHEHQSRSPLQRKPPLPGMKASPSGGQPDLGETSKGFRRSLRLARHLCTVGCGCLATTMAKRTPVCISAAQPNISNSHQNKSGPELAWEAMAGGDQSDVSRGTLASSSVRGLIAPGSRSNPASQPRTPGALGLPRERLNLNTAGLPPRGCCHHSEC